ncbi:MAG: DUF4926 domain-containing protein [Bacteroidetes bacterium]|nr:DUF4926 domain-containing protein [Bacteroidota bacterium]MCW5895033.1 DUF4926 domain-containing protein [Bacteroidota bacterium]
MIREHNMVALTRDIDTYGLKADDVGTIVHCYPDSTAFEVEFIKTGGDTIAVLTLEREEIRTLEEEEILHVRTVKAEAA